MRLILAFIGFIIFSFGFFAMTQPDGELPFIATCLFVGILLMLPLKFHKEKEEKLKNEGKENKE